MTYLRSAAATVLAVVLAPVPNTLAAPETDLSTAKPENVGMSAERLGRIGTAMERYVDASLVAGTVTLVARRGHIVHFEARGYRDVNTQAPMKNDTIFRQASMTKPITSVALMMLWEEGKVQLNDPVAKYLPEFAEVQVSTSGDASGHTGDLEPPNGPMTIRQLLTHTAGLANRYIGNASFYDEHMSFRDRLPGDTLEDWVEASVAAAAQLSSRHRVAVLPCNGRRRTRRRSDHGHVV